MKMVKVMGGFSKSFSKNIMNSFFVIFPYSFKNHIYRSSSYYKNRISYLTTRLFSHSWSYAFKNKD